MCQLVELFFAEDGIKPATSLVRVMSVHACIRKRRILAFVPVATKFRRSSASADWKYLGKTIHKRLPLPVTSGFAYLLSILGVLEFRRLGGFL